MTLLNRSIPNLYNGISQQPPSLRLPSQGELQDNGWMTVADGLSKRPPKQYIKKLNSLTSTVAHCHTIDRDDVEKYEVVVSGSNIYVYDLQDGTQKTVNVAGGTSLTYLSCTTPRDEIAMISVADVTFIVNKTITTAMDVATSPGSVAAGYQEFSNVSVLTPASGTIYHIVGSPSNNFDDYYVKYNGSAYEETVKPGITYKFDPATMPHVLIRESDGTFTFSKITWGERTVGDEESAPTPSFIDHEIKGLFVYRGRLGFISGESVSMSQADSYYDFFRNTVTTILDSDPIDGQVSTGSVSDLHHAAAFNSALLLFSAKKQFQLTSGSILSPKTARIDETTSFNSSPLCQPVGSGQDLFFPVPDGEWTSLREYFVDRDSVSNDAADVTAHCPEYLPAPVVKMSASTNVDALFLVSPTTPNELYVYKFYWGSDQKIQSAWGRFIFHEDDTVLTAEMVDQKLYLVIRRADGMHLEFIDFQPNILDTGLPFQALLDRRVELTGSYNAGTNTTTWTLPYSYTGTMRVIPLGAFGAQAGTSLSTVARPSATTVTATGDYSAGPSVLGIPYTLRYRFSEQFLKDRERVTISTGRLQMRYFTIVFDDTRYFKVEVTPANRDTYTYVYTGKNLGTPSFTVGDLSLSSGRFRFPVKAKASDVTIDIVNDSHLPCVLQSAEWEAFYAARSSR